MSKNTGPVKTLPVEAVPKLQPLEQASLLNYFGAKAHIILHGY
jgi:hypothetical protein